ncbi:hypothetical protein F4806DRAFT_239059 [Annulohypoxylon nitens]|nr:hypothetical protein F4806DRAFT_239059 [Annulohypoxylon nitens]
MSLRLKADSFRKKMKSVRKRLSPSLHEPKLDESQSTSSQSQHRTSGARSSSSNVSRDDLHLHRTKTQNHYVLSRADAVRTINDRARGRGIGNRECIPNNCALNLHLDIGPGESPSGPSTVNGSSQTTTQSQKSKGKSISPTVSSGPQSTIRPEESSSNTSKSKFTVSPQQQADLDEFNMMLLDSDDELAMMLNAQILEKIEKLKAEKAKRAQDGKPEPEPINGPIKGVFELKSSGKDADRNKSTNQGYVGERKFRRWTDDDLDRQCEVMEKYNNGDKLWTKEDLRRVENDIKGEAPYVKFYAYAGKDKLIPKQKLLKDQKIMVEFRGFQDLSCPPASSPDNMLYSSLSLKTVKYDNEDYLAPSDHWTWTNCYKKSWKSLPISHELYAMIMRVPLPPIDKIVCIGLGPISFRPHIESTEMSRNVFCHLGALLIAEALRRRFGATPRLLAQDPEYNPDCKRMLEGKGFEIVGEHGASGLAEINDRTLVYAPNPGFCLKEVVADIAQPAAMFWKPVTTPEQEDAETKSKSPEDMNVMRLSCFTHKRSVDPDTPRVRALVEKYDKHFFPDNNLFGKVVLYTRRGSYVPRPERTPLLSMPKVSRISDDYAHLDESTRDGAPYSFEAAAAGESSKGKANESPQDPIPDSSPSTSCASPTATTSAAPPPPPPPPPSAPGPQSGLTRKTGIAQPPSKKLRRRLIVEVNDALVGQMQNLPQRNEMNYTWRYVRAPGVASRVRTDYALGQAERERYTFIEYPRSRRREQPQPQAQQQGQGQQGQQAPGDGDESVDEDVASLYRGMGYSF